MTQDITTFTDFSRVSENGIDYVMDKDFRSWEIGQPGSGWMLVIKAGTVFQVSVPWWMRWALSPHDKRALLAAAIHDELLNREMDVAFASSEFRRAAKALGADGCFAWALFFSTFIWTFIGRQFEILIRGEHDK